ncbi:hypothetical protein E3C22_19415 [Jiella endophytica]|uniref:Uncharacterized protein n=1 Tax=Jiella endophytica TaxID=2558362 RepID=A0A4Y8RE14_9HYPH|nr:hypothetical protein [Jiella endophytica]TFF19841.1 hypothetical protein E3C22_19415 [Jiella endophytica]
MSCGQHQDRERLAGAGEDGRIREQMQKRINCRNYAASARLSSLTVAGGVQHSTHMAAQSRPGFPGAATRHAGDRRSHSAGDAYSGKALHGIAGLAGRVKIRWAKRIGYQDSPMMHETIGGPAKNAGVGQRGLSADHRE